MFSFCCSWAWPSGSRGRFDGTADARHDADRLDEKIEAHWRLLARTPDSPAAHEAPGDVLRAAGRADEAVAWYQAALDLETKAAAGGQPFGAGLAAGGRGWRTSCAWRGTTPRAAGSSPTARRWRRGSRCAGAAGAERPLDRACGSCGALLPVDSLFDTLRGDRMRRDIFRETANTLAKFPRGAARCMRRLVDAFGVKGVLIIATTAVLAHLLLRRIGGD